MLFEPWLRRATRMVANNAGNQELAESRSHFLERLAAGYPVPRLGTALEVADLICFAASEAAGYITGAAFDINGGVYAA
jgi:NAD(P)-dependent dehydrogenase (short-subunit alcohol dehydrogenase family)